MREEPGDEAAVLEHDVLECICEEDGGDYFGMVETSCISGNVIASRVGLLLES